MKPTLLALLVAAAFAAPALAQNTAESAREAARAKAEAAREKAAAARDAAREHAEAWQSWAHDFEMEMEASLGSLYGPRLMGGQVVKGAPYSAEVVTESIQRLGDGNTIEHRTSGMIYRDSDGRTRQETARDGKVRSIYINDPVEAKRIVLTPGSKRAVVTERNRVVIREEKETRSKDKDTHSKTVRIETRDKGDGMKHQEIRVEVVSPDIPPIPPISVTLPPVPPVPPVPPMPALASFPGLNMMHFDFGGMKGDTASLGTKDFEGVKAEGKKTTWTIPAGEIGNKSPINIVSETWYSPDLKVTVYSKRSDPRSGDVVSRLASIRRTEPARDLFTVPEGYEKRERGKREERK